MYRSALADEASLGHKAEQAGKLRQALNHYLNALQSAQEGSYKDQELRGKILNIVKRIQPPPAIPEEAERHMARGEAAVETAKKKSDFMNAANEFREALHIAPWFADGYYNLGVVLDKAGKYDEAILNLKLYLVGVPNARDAKKLIYKIEYRKEEDFRATIKAKEERKKENGIEALSGIWRKKDVSLRIKKYNYFYIEVVGDEILADLIWDNPPPELGIVPGKSKPYYELRWDGRKLTGRVISNKHNVPVEGIVTKDYNEIKFTEWWYIATPPKTTSIYHKCKTINISSCGK
jgi:tetratricopeptide (TPR) repeat protein